MQVSRHWELRPIQLSLILYLILSLDLHFSPAIFRQNKRACPKSLAIIDKFKGFWYSARNLFIFFGCFWRKNIREDFIGFCCGVWILDYSSTNTRISCLCSLCFCYSPLSNPQRVSVWSSYTHTQGFARERWQHTKTETTLATSSATGRDPRLLKSLGFSFCPKQKSTPVVWMCPLLVKPEGARLLSLFPNVLVVTNTTYLLRLTPNALED